VSPELWALFERGRREEEPAATGEPVVGPVQPPTRDGFVVVDCTAAGDPRVLASALEELGMEDTTIFKRVLSGRLPIAAIGDLVEIESLRLARAALARTNPTHRAGYAVPPQR
jgi:hypothetical protein